jgi:thiol-disulfide isomerase/thioredoxin
MSANTVVKYYGATWCAPCKIAKPEIIKLCKNFGVKLHLYDYDELEEESEKITKLPTVQVWDNTEKVNEFTTNHVAQLESWLSQYVRVIPNDDF